MTTIAHGGNLGTIAGAALEGISRLFPEEYAAGLDAMDAADAAAAAVREARDELDALGPMDREDLIAAAAKPALGAYAEDVADLTAQEDFDAVLAALDAGDDPDADPDADPPLAGGPLGHVGHEPLPKEHFSSAVWEAA